MSEQESRKVQGEIEPLLQTSVICERVVPTPSGKPNLEEVFSLLVRPSLMRFFIFNRYINGLGEFGQKIRIYKPDVQDFIELPELRFRLEDRALAHDMVAQLQVNFDKPGVWWIQILLNDKPILSYPLPVFKGT